MNRRIRIVGMLLVLVLIFGILTSCSTTKENLFSINIVNSKEIQITKYHGKSKTVVIPDMINDLPVTGITPNAFWGASEIKSIVLPETVVTIGNNAFFSCVSLTQFNIPKNLKSLGENVFSGCENLKEITVSDGNEYFSSIDGVLFDKDQQKLIIYPAKKTGDYYQIPLTVEYIGKNAFSNCEMLQQVVYPDSLIEIGQNAFKNCINLADIEIPEGTLNLRAGAFWECVNLSSIKIPSSVDNIGEHIFYGCAMLSSIYVKEGSYAQQWCEDNSRTAAMKFY
ncbi:MAG: leucine-rich repeat domain-containing protein [Clostridia bacterium]|nr:leucine-rich repeat domain-containing protein [Clostridia bacterium]